MVTQMSSSQPMAFDTYTCDPSVQSQHIKPQLPPFLKTLFASLLTLFITCHASLSHAEEKDVASEAFGKLALGQKAAVLTQQLGEPESKGKNALWEAAGEWVQDWNYP